MRRVYSHVIMINAIGNSTMSKRSVILGRRSIDLFTEGYDRIMYAISYDTVRLSNPTPKSSITIAIYIEHNGSNCLTQ